LDAFLGLAPAEQVVVKPAIFPKSKSKGPVVRCIAMRSDQDGAPLSFEVSNVDSVDKVFRILQKHMGVVRFFLFGSTKDNQSRSLTLFPY
jgi:hypothetical protein